MASDLITALYFSHYSQYLTGCISYKIQLKNQKFLDVHPRNLYSYLIALAALLLTAYLGYRTLQISQIEDNLLLLFVNFIYYVIMIASLATNFLLSQCTAASGMALWHKLARLDANLKKLNLQLDYAGLRLASIRYLLIATLAVTVFVTFAVTTQHFQNGGQAFFAYLVLFVGVLNHSSITCGFVTLIRTVTYGLNGVTRRVTSAKTVWELRKIMALSGEFHAVRRHTERLYGVQVLVNFGISFLIITFQAYNIVSSLYNREDFKFSLAASTWIATSLVEVLVLALICHKCTASTCDLRQVLQALLVKQCRNPPIIKEINAFSLQLLHENIEIYAGKMFLIDLPIFLSLLGTTTTYVILLVQTDPGVDLNYSMKKVFGVF